LTSDPVTLLFRYKKFGIQQFVVRVRGFLAETQASKKPLKLEEKNRI
jgi:hypothetical protein